MNDIKFIKKNPLLLDDSLKKRNLPPCSSKIVKIHNEYLEQLNQKQKRKARAKQKKKKTKNTRAKTKTEQQPKQTQT